MLNYLDFDPAEVLMIQHSDEQYIGYDKPGRCLIWFKNHSSDPYEFYGDLAISIRDKYTSWKASFKGYSNETRHQ